MAAHGSEERTAGRDDRPRGAPLPRSTRPGPVRLRVADRARSEASDHGVSEALYLTDPDGLGLEVYRDRPRSRWRTIGDEPVMTVLDVEVEGQPRRRPAT